MEKAKVVGDEKVRLDEQEERWRRPGPRMATETGAQVETELGAALPRARGWVETLGLQGGEGGEQPGSTGSRQGD